MATPVKIRVNPSDTDQRLVLYDNGRFDAYGVTNPMSASPACPTWFEWKGRGPAVDFAVDWSSGQGYTLDFYGGLHAWGGATKVAAPTYAKPYQIYRALVMDPAMDGKGWAMDFYGRIEAFGGAGNVTGWTTQRWSFPIARRLEMSASTRKGYVLDGWGGVHGVQQSGPPSSGYWKNWDIARGLALYVVDGAAKGWKLDGFGGVHIVGSGVQVAAGGPYWGQWDIARDIAILDDGTGLTPLRLAVVDGLGPVHEWTVSTAPTVDVVGPADPTTSTTRPTVLWNYEDAEGDGQAAYQGDVKQGATLIVEFSGTDPAVRGYTLTEDLPNATYTARVMVTDTSGLSSGWDSWSWTQSVTRPNAPTVTATDLGDGTVQVSVSVSSPPAGAVLIVEFSDDAGTTWHELRYDSGASPFIDYEAPFGTARSYRAMVVVPDPWLASEWSTVATVTLSRSHGWSLSRGDGDLLAIPAAEISVSRPIVATVFEPAGQVEAVVVTDGAPRSPRLSIVFRTLDQVTYDSLMALLTADVPLLLREPIGGQGWWFRPVDALDEQWLRASPTSAEVAEGRPLRHARETSVQGVVVARPTVAESARPEL